MDLVGQDGELQFTLQIIRAATGITETYEMVGHVISSPDATDIEPQQERVDHGSNT